MRFNPPPNWPPAPPGWAPDPAWQPDPAWGPPPPGWPLWVDDAAAGQPQPPSGRGRWLLLAALAAVVLIVAAVLVFVVARHSADKSASTKPDITSLSKDLLVSESLFPDLGDDATWSDSQKTVADNEFGPPDDITVDPPKCADLVDAPASTTESVGGERSDFTVHHSRSYIIQLTLGPDQVPFGKLVDSCQGFTITDHSDGATHALSAAVQPLAVADLPSWATAYTIRIGGSAAEDPEDSHSVDRMGMAIIAGYYRGVLIEAQYADNIDDANRDTFGADVADPLRRLFTAQVDKLEAAP